MFNNTCHFFSLKQTHCLRICGVGYLLADHFFVFSNSKHKLKMNPLCRPQYVVQGHPSWNEQTPEGMGTPEVSWGLRWISLGRGPLPLLFGTWKTWFRVVFPFSVGYGFVSLEGNLFSQETCCRTWTPFCRSFLFFTFAHGDSMLLDEGYTEYTVCEKSYNQCSKCPP